MNEKINDIIKQMTLEEKAGMCSGDDFWHLKSVERLGVPRVMVSDGPHGLRKQDDAADHLGINDSIKAVCFPTSAGTASSFDRDLLKRLGEILGEECQAENVAVLLGPAVNIKRSPLCGRNFEYLSEDPYLTGELSASYISGVQSKNIGTSMKHYAVNSQETRRMTSSSNLDERTLREIYLPGFEIPVKKSDPWTIMSSYNRVNGEYASESKKLLTDILREEWGFNGFVVSDWSGTNDRVKGLEAGEELEMPSSNGLNDKKIVEAVQNGSLDEKILDKAVYRILDIIFRYTNNRDESAVFDRDEHHELAREVALESMVLLRNENNILPLDASKKIAFIGEFAKVPRYQGSGSSYINSHKVVGALEAVKDVTTVTYAQGYEVEADDVNQDLHDEALRVAREAEIVVVFAGLPGRFESEGFDRKHMDMPTNQVELIHDLSKVNKNVVVVLHNGSPITMPWINDVSAVLESYLAGEAVGEAQVSLLFGHANPSGKLAESFPLKLSDNPSYLNFPGHKDEVNYAEGIFVGYRHYDSKEMDVLFPFGHGLSYTSFEYSDLKLSHSELQDKEEKLHVSVTIKNTGNVAGKESVQLYVKPKNNEVIRPEKELKQFAKVSLEPQESKTVTLELDYRSFAYYNTELNDWWVEAGEYEILAAKSSRDIPLSTSVTWNSPTLPGFRVHDNTTIGDLLSHPVTKPIVEAMVAQMQAESPVEGMDSDQLGGAGAEMMYAMMKDMPMRSIRIFGGEQIASVYDGIIAQLNGALESSESNNK